MASDDLGGSARRYLIVGLFNTGLDLLLFTALAVAVGLPPVIANVVSTIVVMTISFFLNRAWVFRAEGAGLRAYVAFVAVTLFSGLVVQSLVILGVLGLADVVVPDLSHDIAAPLAKVAAMGVGMVSNFLGYRWVFGAAGTPDRPRADRPDPVDPHPTPPDHPRDR